MTYNMLVLHICPFLDKLLISNNKIIIDNYLNFFVITPYISSTSVVLISFK